MAPPAGAAVGSLTWPARLRSGSPDPERVARSNLTHFTAELERRTGRRFPDYAALHRDSVEQRETFWRAVWDVCGVIGDPGDDVLLDRDRMPGARFFPDARLNFAENLLRRRDDTPALLASSERGPDRVLSFGELHDGVAAAAAALRRDGIGPGDRVCGVMANVPEAIVAALGAAAIGAIWSSCSPDFGVRGVLDRFGQIAPAVLLGVAGYDYGGRTFDLRSRLADVAAGLPSLRRVVVVPPAADAGPGAGAALPAVPTSVSWTEWLDSARALPFTFARFPFAHPLYVLYSSGTTGVPKCIVHGAGGTLLQHLKEHRLHCDVRSGDRVFYFTTCGWMMWNWLVTGLASEAALVLYDGVAVPARRHAGCSTWPIGPASRCSGPPPGSSTR